MLPHQVPESLRARIIELEAAVEARFSRHRGVVRGEELDDNEIKRILARATTPPSVARRRRRRRPSGRGSPTTFAGSPASATKAARALGHRDWFALSLANDELDEQKLLQTLAACDRATAEPFGRWKGELDARLADRFGCAVSELRPWHYADPFFQEPPAEAAA